MCTDESGPRPDYLRETAAVLLALAVGAAMAAVVAVAVVAGLALVWLIPGG